ITASFVTKHLIRQIIKHRGKIFDSSFNQGVPHIDFFGFDLEAYNCVFTKWRIPKGSSRGQRFTSLDAAYPQNVDLNNPPFEMIEGWRAIEVVDTFTKPIFAADWRGIHYLEQGEIVKTLID